MHSLTSHHLSCCFCTGPCFPGNTYWQFYCPALKLLRPCSVAFFLFLVQRRCRYHIIVRLLVVYLYPMYFGAHGDNYSSSFALNAAPGLLVLLSKCSVLLCEGLMSLINCTLPLPSSQNPLFCVDFQHVTLIAWSLLTTLSKYFLIFNGSHDMYIYILI